MITTPNVVCYPAGGAGAWGYPRRPQALDAMGVNVHFFTPNAGQGLITTQDLDWIQAAGFKKIRMDLLWSVVEKQKGVYDFRPYDWVIHELLRRGIQPMIILGLGNPLYAKGLTIYPRSTQEAFERYGMAAVNRYKGKGIIWELVNEPNHEFFWQPKPNVDDYMALAKRLLPKLKAIDPSGFFAAPSTAGTPLGYLERCFQQGLLNWVDGVTIHPYQAYPTNKIPEYFEREYQQARALIDRYVPTGKKIPILLGEWGFSTAAGEVDEATQAQYMVRQALLGMMYGSPVNIWYNWKGDIHGGGSPTKKEHNFGLVRQDVTPKPAYWAMWQMAQMLYGHTFERRLPSHPQDYLLLFSADHRRTLVGWTIGSPHTLVMGSSSMRLTGKPAYWVYPKLPYRINTGSSVIV